MQAYLRRLLATDRVSLIAPARAGMSVEIAAGDEVIGTVHKDTEDGDISFAIHITVLEEDLPPPARAAPAAPARRR